MKASEKYDRVLTGALSGIIVPFIVMLLFFLWKSGTYNFVEFFDRLISAGVLTNVVSFSVFANVFFFLMFNRFDMLKASRGILGITIIWAIIVFIVKLS
jgi:Fe2+ transport system protein B